MACYEPSIHFSVGKLITGRSRQWNEDRSPVVLVRSPILIGFLQQTDAGREDMTKKGTNNLKELEVVLL